METEKKDSLLIVDDDKSNLLVLIDILQQTYVIYTAKDGEDGIKKAEKYLPDLILLDIVLPAMDGYEVFAKLKESGKTAKIPVIFITGLDKSGSEEKGLEIGAVDYITKPFDPAIVKIKVAQQLKIINLQRDLEIAAQVAEAASESKSQFLAKVSHEIRTPMNAILGIAKIQLRKGNLEPEIEKAFYNIRNSGDLLLGLINDILDLSKIEAGKMELQPAKYEIATLLNDIINLNIIRIGNKPIEFQLSVDENLPATLIGDDIRIKQIMNNLLSNAFKYTDRGIVKLSVSFETTNESIKHESVVQPMSSSNPNVIIIFDVSDTGQGMSKEQIDKLFNNEYVRFNMEANRSTEGTGLGMSITNNLVNLMKGSISVEGTMGKGTTFSVRLPQETVGSCILGKELAESLEKLETNVTKLLERTQIIIEPMPYGSVLVVDDVDLNLYVAEGTMEPYKLSIETAISGKEAIKKIEDGKVYDIVFMDHMMPGMDGIESTKRIRELGYTNPIVALTANAVAGQSEIFLANGFDDFISKPIDMMQLNSILIKFVRDKQPPEVIEAANRHSEGYSI